MAIMQIHHKFNGSGRYLRLLRALIVQSFCSLLQVAQRFLLMDSRDWLEWEALRSSPLQRMQLNKSCHSPALIPATIRLISLSIHQRRFFMRDSCLLSKRPKVSDLLEHLSFVKNHFLKILLEIKYYG